MIGTRSNLGRVWLTGVVCALVSGCMTSPDTARLERQIQELKDDVYILKRQRQETIDRLAELEGRAPASASAKAVRKPAPLPGTVAFEPREPQKVAPKPPPPVSPKPAVRASRAQNEPESYRHGVAAFQAGDYSIAVQRLSVFLRDQPNHAQAASAQFVIGEAYFAEANFPQAIIEYQKLLASYPRSDHVPGALYGIGLSYYELNYYTNALTHLQKLVAEHPESSLAQEAKPLIERARRRIK